MEDEKVAKIGEELADIEYCPQCGKKWNSQCKCMIGEYFCPNGHIWFRCPKHRTIVIGAPDHKKEWSGACQCPDAPPEPEPDPLLVNYKQLHGTELRIAEELKMATKQRDQTENALSKLRKQWIEKNCTTCKYTKKPENSMDYKVKLFGNEQRTIRSMCKCKEFATEPLIVEDIWFKDPDDTEDQERYRSFADAEAVAVDYLNHGLVQCAKFTPK